MCNDKQVPDIGVLYTDGSLSLEELADYEHSLNAVGVSFDSRLNNTIVQASLDIFVPFVQIFLSQSFLVSISAAIVWDTIKAVVGKIIKAVMNKHPRWLSSSAIEDVKEPIHIVAGNVNIVLPSGCSDETIHYAIDKAFEYIKTPLNGINTSERIFALYDEESGCYKPYTESEIIKQAIAEHELKRQIKHDEMTIKTGQDSKEPS